MHPRQHFAPFVAALCLALMLSPCIASAKRTAPPKVTPVVYEGIRYVAPNDDGRRAYVQAWDPATNKKLWEVTIFRNFIMPFEEENVQHVFIKQMKILDAALIITAEDDRVYRLDLKRLSVKKL